MPCFLSYVLISLLCRSLLRLLIATLVFGSCFSIIEVSLVMCYLRKMIYVGECSLYIKYNGLGGTCSGASS